MVNGSPVGSGGGGGSGAQGPQGASGDRYVTQTQALRPAVPPDTGFFYLDISGADYVVKVATGLAYTANSSVMASLTSSPQLSSYQGLVKSYNSATGMMVIRNITNVRPPLTVKDPYTVNLNGIDGARGPQGFTGAQGSIGPQGPSGGGGSGGTSYWDISNGSLAPNILNPILFPYNSSREITVVRNKINLIGQIGSTTTITLDPDLQNIVLEDPGSRASINPVSAMFTTKPPATTMSTFINTGTISLTNQFNNSNSFLGSSEIRVRRGASDESIVYPGYVTVTKVTPTANNELTSKQYVDGLLGGGTRPANTWFVATNGSNTPTSTSGSINNPFLTITYALSMVQSNASSTNIQVIFIAPGTYSEANIIITTPNIWLVALPVQSQFGKNTVQLNASPVIQVNSGTGQVGLAGLTINGTLNIQSATAQPHDIILKDCNIQCGDTGLAIVGSNLSQIMNVYVQNCIIENTGTASSSLTLPLISLATPAFLYMYNSICRSKNHNSVLSLSSGSPGVFGSRFEIVDCILEQTKGNVFTVTGGVGTYRLINIQANEIPINGRIENTRIIGNSLVPPLPSPPSSGPTYLYYVINSQPTNNTTIVLTFVKNIISLNSTVPNGNIIDLPSNITGPKTIFAAANFANSGKVFTMSPPSTALSTIV
jgi:hypothetical protein